jgi:hypothetical protein
MWNNDGSGCHRHMYLIPLGGRNDHVGYKKCLHWPEG